VTNNNGFWIGWSDLLPTSLQLQLIITAHNQCLSKIRSIPCWTTSVFSSTVTDLVLIYESVTYESRRTNKLSWTENSNQVKVKETLRLTVSRSVGLGLEPHLGPMTRYLFLSDSYVLVSMGRPLWREDGSVFCLCRWSLPAQTSSGPSPLGLATVFYCLRFETSLFVASYDSQNHGLGIRPRHHTSGTHSTLHTFQVKVKSKSKSHCEWRSVSQ
jgi:hypothetical protein